MEDQTAERTLVIGNYFSTEDEMEDELGRYESVQRWLTRLRKKGDSPNTRDMYLRSLRRFCEYAEMTPDMLIEERDRDIKSMDRFKRRRAEERLDGWFVELEKQGLARSSCVAYKLQRDPQLLPTQLYGAPID